MKEGLYVSSFKEVYDFYCGSFCLFALFGSSFTTDRKNDNSVNAKAEAAYNQTTTVLLIVSERLLDRLVKITIFMLLF